MFLDRNEGDRGARGELWEKGDDNTEKQHNVESKSNHCSQGDLLQQSPWRFTIDYLLGIFRLCFLPDKIHVNRFLLLWLFLFSMFKGMKEVFKIITQLLFLLHSSLFSRVGKTTEVAFPSSCLVMYLLP